jgi:hypothetical protein
MAMGISARKVGLHENVSDSMKFMKQKGIS